SRGRAPRTVAGRTNPPNNVLEGEAFTERDKPGSGPPRLRKGRRRARRRVDRRGRAAQALAGAGVPRADVVYGPRSAAARRPAPAAAFGEIGGLGRSQLFPARKARRRAGGRQDFALRLGRRLSRRSE